MYLSSETHTIPWQPLLALAIIGTSAAIAIWQSHTAARKPVAVKIGVMWWVALMATVLGLGLGLAQAIERPALKGSACSMQAKGLPSPGHSHTMYIVTFLVFGATGLLTMLLTPLPNTKRDTKKKQAARMANLKVYVMLGISFGLWLLCVGTHQAVRVEQGSVTKGVSNQWVVALNILMGLGLIVPSAYAASFR